MLGKLFRKPLYHTQFDEDDQTLYLTPTIRDTGAFEDGRDYATKFWHSVSELVYEKENRRELIGQKRGSERLKTNAIQREELPQNYVVQLGKRTPDDALQILREEYADVVSESNNQESVPHFSVLEDVWNKGRFTFADVDEALDGN